MPRRAATCPPSPYTTLFRSRILALLRLPIAAAAVAALVLVGLAPQAVADPVGALDAEDRKSTRLNSSHVASSYAVFCLKKRSSTGLTHGRHQRERFTSSWRA